MILSYAELSEGSSVSNHSLAIAEKKIKRNGPFKSVSVTYDEAIKRVSINVVENPLITEIVFDGISIYSAEDLLSLITSTVNTPLNMKHVSADIIVIESK